MDTGRADPMAGAIGAAGAVGAWGKGGERAIRFVFVVRLVVEVERAKGNGCVRFASGVGVVATADLAIAPG